MTCTLSEIGRLRFSNFRPLLFQRDPQSQCHSILKAEITREHRQLKNSFIIQASLSQLFNLRLFRGPRLLGETGGLLE